MQWAGCVRHERFKMGALEWTRHKVWALTCLVVGLADGISPADGVTEIPSLPGKERVD